MNRPRRRPCRPNCSIILGTSATSFRCRPIGHRIFLARDRDQRNGFQKTASSIAGSVVCRSRPGGSISRRSRDGRSRDRRSRCTHRVDPNRGGLRFADAIEAHHWRLGQWSGRANKIANPVAKRSRHVRSCLKRRSQAMESKIIDLVKDAHQTVKSVSDCEVRTIEIPLNFVHWHT